MKRPCFTPGLLLALAATFTLAALCGHAPAQEVEDLLTEEGLAKREITAIDIRYQGPQTIDPNRIRGMLSSRVGQFFSIEATERDIETLGASGEIENVQILQEPFRGGVRLIYVVQTRAALGTLRFQGNTKFKERKLRDKVEIASGDTISELTLLEGKEAIEKLYIESGYSDVQVAYDVRNTDRDGFQDVIYSINEGGQAWVRKVRFEGVSSVKRGDLKRKLASKQRNWLSWLTREGVLDNLRVQADKTTVERMVQDEGHMKARVVDVRTERVDAKRVDLVFVVEEGPVYTINSVAIDGMRLFEPQTIMAEFLLTAGMPFSTSLVDKDAKLIRDYYGSEGYADARVDVRREEVGPGLVDIIYSVEEGGKSFVGRVNISGNTKTKDKVIRREVSLGVVPGDVFNTVEVEVAQKRLENTRHFASVDMLPSLSDQAGYRDLNITVEEQNTGSLVFGAGFSSIDSIVGYVNVTQTNFDIMDWPSFQGAGQKFNMNLRIGTERKDFTIGLEEPWFLDRQLRLGGDLFFRDLAFLSDDFQQQNAGGSLRLRKPVGNFHYIQLQYILQQVKIHEISGRASPEIRAEEGDYLQNKLELEWVTDTRDAVLTTRRGGLYRAGVNGSFGGDVEAWGIEASAVHFWSLPFDWIFSLQGRIAAVDGNDVPIFERLFLGGANTLRGFDFRDVGPKDINGEPIGGQTSAFGSAEITFPLIANVRGAAFYDVGLVNEDSFDFGTGDYNSNVGLGLRLFLPFGPLNIDYGVPIESDEFNDSSGKFQFNVGYRF